MTPWIAAASPPNVAAPSQALTDDAWDAVETRAHLHALASQVEQLGLNARIDYATHTVNVVSDRAERRLEDGGIRVPEQTVVLRWSSGAWAWWLLWPGEVFESGETVEPDVERIAPADQVSDVARRVRQVLRLEEPIPV